MAAVKFKDYYELLGVERDASTDEVRKAFRRLARKYHPDVNRADAQAEERFKEINEAYEVLRDPQKRKKYDALGANWKQGMDFSPPPGWEGSPFHFGPGAEFEFTDLGGGGHFSDFFNLFFGHGGAASMGGDASAGACPSGQTGGRAGRSSSRWSPFGNASPPPPRGGDAEAVLELTLEEAHRGGRKGLSLTSPDGETRNLTVAIPPGVAEGSKIRLAGQGVAARRGGQAGDLFLRVKLLPHPRYRVEGSNLLVDLPLAPWEAALGAKVAVKTLDGSVTLTIPPGTCSGRKMRLRDKGLGKRDGARGDLYVVAKLVVPEALTARERELFEALRVESGFRPRD